jgi:archaellum biogenesis protein FlaJ (TadC family)
VADSISSEDLERVKLLEIVSKKGLKELSLRELKRLQILVEKKDYSHSKKAHKSKMKILARINVAIYEVEEGREGI